MLTTAQTLKCLAPLQRPLTIHNQNNTMNWEFKRQRNTQTSIFYNIKASAGAAQQEHLPKQGRTSRDPRNCGKQTAPAPAP